MKNFFIALFCFYALRLSAQDPHFTQFYANPLYTNPATAGTAFYDKTQSGRSLVQFRNQWHGATGSYRTFCLGWDQAFDAVKGGFGASYTMDVVGSGYLITNHLSGHYAVSLKTSPTTTLRWGLQAGIMRRAIDYSRMIIGEHVDTFLIPDQNSYSKVMTRAFPDFSTGFLYTGKAYFIGAALFHLSKPNQSFFHNPDDHVPRRVAIHFGYSFMINDLFSIIPMAQFQKQANFSEVFGGTMCQYRNLMAGLWYRHTIGQFTNADAVALNLGVDIKNFRLNYSVDRTVSEARSSLPFSHEISLQYRWKTKQSREKESQALY